MPNAVSSQSNSISMSSIDYKEALKYGALATITILATTILAALVVSSVVLGGFACALATVDGGLNALFCLIFAGYTAYGTWHLAIKAKEYCMMTHYILNP